MLAVELLERVVREHHGTRPLGNAQHEGITPADGTRRRGDHLTIEHGGPHLVTLFVGDAVLESGIHDHDDAGVGILGRVGVYRLVELLQAWQGSALGGQV